MLFVRVHQATLGLDLRKITHVRLQGDDHCAV